MTGPRFVVITGTDTGVGKTVCGVALAGALTAAGLRVRALKPVETGCGPEPDPGEDGARLAAATGQPAPTRALLRFATPAAPCVAAEREGRGDDLETPALLALVRAALAGAPEAPQVVLVEGAGGALSPIGWGSTILDLAVALDAGVVLVAADRLGVIHQVRAAAEAVRSRALPLAAVVLSAIEGEPSHGAAVRRALPGAPVLALPRCAQPQDGWPALAPLVEALGAPAGRPAGPLSPPERPEPWPVALARAAAEREAAGLSRALPELRPLGPVRALRGDRERVLFSTNDYLGLSGHPEVRHAAAHAAAEAGMGPRGSALVCGRTAEHAALEAGLAALVGAERALLLPTGYAANVAAVTALADDRTELVSDALNHASLIDGCRLAQRSGARLSVTPHGDVDAVEAALRRSARAGRRALVLTESIFSMDGDRAPLAELVALCARHGAWLLVDEAHATLVLGPTGGGLLEHLGLSGAAALHVGTLSKAVGALGGFVAGPAAVVEQVLQRARTHMFSTALPLPVVAAARAALRVGSGPANPYRAALWARTLQLAGRLQDQGVDVPPPQSPILPFVLGSAERAMAATALLEARGLHVPGIRPPTVPPGTARLRVSVSAAHTPGDVELLAQALAQVLRASS